MDIIAFLTKTFLFESLSKSHTELLACIAEEKHVQKGDIIFSDGMPAQAFYIIVSGSAKIYKLSADGNEQIIHIHHSGELMAEAIIFEFKTYPAFCEALEDTDLLRFSKKSFLEILRQAPELTFNIMSAYSRRLRQLINKIEELSLHNIKSRLAVYLLKNSKMIDNIPVCTLKLSKKDLAAVLGTIPETLSRTLQFFKKEEIIDVSKDEIIILDIERLKVSGAQ